MIMERIFNIDNNILGGMPVFFGTKVPAKNLFDYLKSNADIEDFLRDFESISREQQHKKRHAAAIMHG
jgi:uncharacterized protein (DUF433 family)